ncbi:MULTISPECIES: LysR substrate-binding domain-containing protein [Paraburkholderia]|uniref:LysR substrate-binding domain-containing protein n=1 Tax=Paraburkholderia TaxID=1822464 RepID=UPI001B14CBD4|nr:MULTISPECIES: LysR substrate-binding domain-containing protein [Paraburkholderia]MCX4138109.1 LysR substrate-binding domain-containing protein [Paraburkholderia aspalathi]MCX4155868.1 LysR substrate-binding domain-containing protein [Paraburkholderia aspalathi]MDN7165275.1 LysR substrate-binding domain-containing protein [Paraburkholderia sp. SECH2]MDN7170800.1 LysR substrate-binding domain-containing protein [Paraburkholderia sp. SEWSISQ10-3 4]MDQ6393761.1 LysR substrate-binding domain-con
MFDLELLKTLICVVDEGSFTRAGERVHRTQSTVSQQVRKLEESVGRPLLLRDRTGSHVIATEHGVLLTQYARRLLALSQEAQEALRRDVQLSPVRIGVPEDFDARRMSAMLSGFLKIRPDARLETLAGMSAVLQQKLSGGEIDIALVKREPGSGDCYASWPEALVWVRGRDVVLPKRDSEEPVALALFPDGCIYRKRAIRSLDKAKRAWRVAFGSQSLTGIQAAVAAGLAISVLPRSAVLPEHRICTDMPPLPPTELALIGAGDVLDTVQQDLIEFLTQKVRRA